MSIVAAICERLANRESLKSICADPAMPVQSTVYKWLAEQPEFSKMYARARELQADALFDEMLDIADTPQPGVRTVEKPSGTETTTLDMIEHRRLQIDARKWIVAKLAPKKYGEKFDVTQTHKGVVQTVALQTNDPVEAAKLYQQIINGET